MATLLQFAILTSLSVIFIIDWPDSLATGVYHNEEYQNEGFDTNYYKASKKAYFNPFGYKTCRKGKFRFDWMRKKNSLFCPRSGGRGKRSALEELDNHTNEDRPMGQPRIVKGFFPEVGEFPSYVQLQVGDPSFKDSSYCGGILLNDYLILTAAHCVANHTAGFAFAGSIHSSGGEERVFKRACLPKEFTGNFSDKETRGYDWAILELDGQFELNRNVQPACVNLDYKLARDIKCVVVGFGYTDQNNITSPLLKAAVVKHLEPYVDERGLIWTSEARGEVGGGLGCPGESGGPLYCFENCSGPPKMYVVGVVSFGRGEGHVACSTDNSLAFVNTVNLRKLMPSLIKEMMNKREKRSVRRLAPAEEMDSRPLSGKGFRCVDFKKPYE